MRKFLLLTTASLMLAACSSNGGPGVTETPDGTKIDLNNSPKGLITANTSTGTLTGYNQDSSFYGVWIDNSRQVREVRMQGTITPDREIPQSGRATYYGNAVRLDSITNDVLADGTSRINVDFGNKTVDGEITMPGLRRDITLHTGNLRGAEYSGSASVLGNSSGSYEGKLFGKNAAETAGIVTFSTNSDLNTSFGGKKY